MAKEIKTGMRVAYTRNALRTLGNTYAELRGTVIAIKEHSPGWSLATVEWEGKGGLCWDTNVKNLCTVKCLAFVE